MTEEEMLNNLQEQQNKYNEVYEILIRNLKSFINKTPSYLITKSRGESYIIYNVANKLILKKEFSANYIKNTIEEHYHGDFQLNNEARPICIDDKDAEKLFSYVNDKLENLDPLERAYQQNKALINLVNKVNNYLEENND